MNPIITREDQVVTLSGVGYYKKHNRVVTGVVVTRVIEKNGKTFGTAKIEGVTHALVLDNKNRWTVAG